MRSFFLLTLLTSVVSLANGEESKFSDATIKQFRKDCGLKDENENNPDKDLNKKLECFKSLMHGSGTSPDRCEAKEAAFTQKRLDVEKKCAEAGFSGSIKTCVEQANVCAKENRRGTSGVVESLGLMIGTIGGAAMTPTTTSSKCAKYNLENWERRYDKLNSDMKETSAKSNDLQNEITRATEELNRVKTQIAESNQRDTKSDSETKNELKEKEKAAIEKLNETAEKGKLEIIELQRKITNAHSEMQKSSSQYEASLALFTKAQKERACIKQIRDRLATLKGSTTGNVGGAISGAKYTKSELQSDYQICMINLDSQHLAQIQNWEGRKLDFAKQMEVLEEQKATLDKTIRNLPVDIAKAQAQTNDLNAQLTQQAIQRSKNNYNQLVGANQVFDQTKQALAIKQADYAKQLNALSNQAMSLGPKPDSDTKATSGEAVSEMGALLSQTKSIQACCAKSSSTFCNDFKKTSENIDEDSPFMELKDLQYDLESAVEKSNKK